MTGLAPLAEPVPLHSSHSPSVAKSIFDGIAEHRLLEVELEFVAQVGAAKHLRATAATASAEDVAEDVAENIPERVARIETLAAARPAA